MSINAMKSLELAIAEKQLSDYARDAVCASSGADECSQAECRLDRAVEAFRWIARAEEAVRQATYEGLTEFTPQVEESLDSLYRRWLGFSETTECDLIKLDEQGCIAANASEFREVAAQAREKINSMAWLRKSRKLRNAAPCEASES
ncbi:MAG TPA: hypothetical protein VFI31_09780 [Pirellulales bacterium]|nr:hypothetical protein [Pirellulales bacterium]